VRENTVNKRKNQAAPRTRSFARAGKRRTGASTTPWDRSSPLAGKQHTGASATVAENVSTAETATGVPSTDAVPVMADGNADGTFAVNQTQKSATDPLAGVGTLSRRHAVANLVVLLLSIGGCALPIYWATTVKHADKSVQTDPMPENGSNIVAHCSVQWPSRAHAIEA